jgi:hypothetical protein
MVHYLRTLDGTTIVDIEATAHDINCVVPIEAFSNLLLSKFTNGFCNEVGGAATVATQEKTVQDVREFISDFDEIQEVRGTYFETQHGFGTPDELAEHHLKILAEKWQLYYVTD